MPSSRDLKSGIREKKLALQGRAANQSSALSRFTEGRPTLKMKRRNLDSDRRRGHKRRRKWMT